MFQKSALKNDRPLLKLWITIKILFSILLKKIENKILCADFGFHQSTIFLKKPTIFQR